MTGEPIAEMTQGCPALVETARSPSHRPEPIRVLRQDRKGQHRADLGEAGPHNSEHGQTRRIPVEHRLRVPTLPRGGDAKLACD
jgi:hypothetical protein